MLLHQLERLTCIRLENSLQEQQYGIGMLPSICSNAVQRDNDLVVTHVGIVTREQHTYVRCHACNDNRLRSQVLGQLIKLCIIERRVLRLEHEVICIIGCKLFDQRFAANAIGLTMFDLGVQVRSPLARIVVRRPVVIFVPTRIMVYFTRPPGESTFQGRRGLRMPGPPRTDVRPSRCAGG